VASLPQIGSTRLRTLWFECFGRSVPVPPRNDFLIRCLAYRIQEEAHGGLNAATRKRLHKLAGLLENNPNSASFNARRIKPGTRLIREWRGDIHEVVVTDKGFAFRGKRYRSLSEIARAITGTRWSGPLFFGLKSAATKVQDRRHGA